MGTMVSTGTAEKKPGGIVFAGGGTAGHVFPGLAVAAELDCRVVWIGSSAGVEKKIVADAGFEFHSIPAGKLRRYPSLRNLSDLFRIVAGVVAAVRILRRERPALLFSKGGFVSVPPVIAAWLCHIPSWTHESDFDPGLATRINLRFSEKVLVSLPETARYIPERYQKKVVVTGNPVRGALYAADPARGRSFVRCPDSAHIVFVIGGSLGSSFINGLIAASRPFSAQGVYIVHQTGAAEKNSVAGEAVTFPRRSFIRSFPTSWPPLIYHQPGRSEHACRDSGAGQAVFSHPAPANGKPRRPASKCRGVPCGGSRRCSS